MDQPMPAFIINRNLVTWPRTMVKDLERMGCRPIILDNDSTYAPLLDWYASNPCEVVMLGDNVGHHCPWTTGVFQHYTEPDSYYVVTDPDLDLSSCPDDTVGHLVNLYDRYPDITKAGISLEVLDLPEESPVYQNVLGWETPFWQQKRDWQCYDAPIDTTFAVYSTKRGFPLHHGQFNRAVRADRPFTARHLPFYLTSKNFTHEDWYYLKKAIGSASTMGKYLQCLVDEYALKNPRKCKEL